MMRLLTGVGVSVFLLSCGTHETATLQQGASSGFVVEGEAAFLPTKSTAMATGVAPAARIVRQWPFDILSIGHTMASYQNYGGTPYFHHGLDLRGDAGTTVYSASGGKVVNIENYIAGDAAYWEVAVLDEHGLIWQYHHIDRSSIPQEVWDAYRNKTEIAPRTKLGEIFYWSVVTYGERYHHLHLNILDKDRNYLNPFSFLESVADIQPPVILDIGLHKSGRKVKGSAVSGTYGLYAKIHDLILHQKFVVPANEVTLRIDGGPEQMLWRFDGLPGGASITEKLNDFYVSNLTCGDYRCRNLTLDLGFKATGHRSFPQEKGPHSVHVIARDHVGNEAHKNYTWTVQ